MAETGRQISVSRPAARPRARGRLRVHRRGQVVRPQHRAGRAQPRHPRRHDLDDPRPVGNRQVGHDQAPGRAALPGRGRHPRARRVGAGHDRRRAVRDAQEVRRAVPGRCAVRLDEPLRQRRPSRCASTPRRPRTRSRAIVNRRLGEVGLGGAEDKMPNELSGGMRKRAGFARALVLDPEIVLFDEPDSGLDPVRTALLCELIKEVHEENGGTYVVITHDIASARRLAEYMAILWRGKIVEAGLKEELFESDNEFVRQFLSADSAGPLVQWSSERARRAALAPLTSLGTDEALGRLRLRRPACAGRFVCRAPGAAGRRRRLGDRRDRGGGWRCGSSRAPRPRRWSTRDDPAYKATRGLPPRVRRRPDRRARAGHARASRTRSARWC